jgi:hypothetical protein
MLDNFKPGQQWLDTNGKPFQAQASSVLLHEVMIY